MAEPVITTKALTYSYGKSNPVLKGIDLNVEEGSIYGFLGPNGSGKTTTLSLLLGLLESKQGAINIFGKELNGNRLEILSKIGSLVEAPSLYLHLTARENLEVYRHIHSASKSRVDEVLKLMDLANTGKKTVKKFSLGMKQRLAIALALLPNPKLLVLDEPANGLDPAGIIELRQFIRKLNKAYGMTIIISSHLLSEVEKMVTHLGIIYKGELLFQGTMQELNVLQQKSSRLHINTSDNLTAWRLLKAYEPEASEEGFSVRYESEADVAMVGKTIVDNDLQLYMLHPRKNDLEQLFIHLTSN